MLMVIWYYLAAQNCGDNMAELNTKLNCKKDGVTEEITAYTTLDEVQNTGIGITIGGIEGYIKYGDASDANASQLNCKVPNDDTTYRVHLTAIQPTAVNLICKNVEDDTILTTVKYAVPDDGVLYLNNDNAPSISGYDFVLLDGIKHTGVVEDDVFTVYYVDNTVFDRTKTSWSSYFASQTSITETPIVNTYSATSMAYMFNGCSALTSVPQMNTSKVTDMNYMFYKCFNLTSVPQMDTSNVTSMSSMFDGCTALTSVPQMNTSKVTGMSYMFNSCKALTSVPQMDTSNVTSMSSMFDGCTALTSVPQMNTSNVTSMRYMFNGCSALTSVPQMNTSKVTDMGSMFYKCFNLTTIPQMNTSKVTGMRYMFSSCKALTSIDWEIDMSSCTNCDYMFSSCPATGIRLKNVPSSLDLSKIDTKNYTVVNYI